jgi:CBS domain containing-hemolysin-like protein
VSAVALALIPAFLAAIFAAASATLGSLSGARRAALRDTLEGKPRAAIERYIAAGAQIESRWLVLRVLGISTSALLVYRQLPESFGGWGALIAALLALIAYGVPTEVGRVFFVRTADFWAPLLLRLLRPFELLVAPVAAPISWVGGVIGRLVTRPISSAASKVTENEVEIIVRESEQSGVLGHDQSEMIQNVLDFGAVTAGEVMVPRTHVAAFDIDTPADELLIRIAETEHSRYPVYKGGIDNVVGILHVKDLVSYAASRELKELRLPDIVHQPVTFVPESQTASSVLKDMRAGRQHLAVVIDEFGGMSGIVTLEDLIEEIVGDIRDEHDDDEAPIVDLGEGRLLVDASISIADLSRYLGADLPEDGDYNSLGGFLVDRLGSVPKPGARLDAMGLDFVVRDADERHVMKVEIVRKTPPPESVAPRSSSRMTAA